MFIQLIKFTETVQSLLAQEHKVTNLVGEQKIDKLGANGNKVKDQCTKATLNNSKHFQPSVFFSNDSCCLFPRCDGKLVFLLCSLCVIETCCEIVLKRADVFCTVELPVDTKQRNILWTASFESQTALLSLLTERVESAIKKQLKLLQVTHR